jgi:uncharacterized membrane protein YbhN (UPF0104 family)
VSHVLALAALALDVLVRAWRIQLAVWCAGGRLGFGEAVRLNLYGEAASTLTPNRLGGEPARFVGLTQAGLRPVTALVGLGVEVAAEWPVFALMALGLAAYYVPGWESRAELWLKRHLATDLVLFEATVLAVLLVVYLIQRFLKAGTVRHRVRRQWRVAMAHVRRAPWWVMLANAGLTAVSLAARALVLPALAWGGGAAPPPFAEMFVGSLALLAAPLAVPLPSGGGGLEVAFLSGFAGEFGSRQVLMLLLWRFYTTILLTGLGVYAMIRSLGLAAAKELFTIGWIRRRKESE